MVRYEGGYAVETVFDGSKLGIEPYAVEVTPAGELLVLDSMNSNVYRVQLPLSRCEHTKTASSYPDRHVFLAVCWYRVQYVGHHGILLNMVSLSVLNMVVKYRETVWVILMVVC
jgi:hypothetical protein